MRLQFALAVTVLMTSHGHAVPTRTPTPSRGNGDSFGLPVGRPIPVPALDGVGSGARSVSQDLGWLGDATLLSGGGISVTHVRSAAIRAFVAQVGGFSFSSSSLTFTGTAGGLNPEAQSVTLTSNTPAILQAFFLSATTSSGGNWLSVSPASGFTPRALTVTVNTAGIAAGNYSGQIVVTAPNALAASMAVTLNLAAGLVVSPAALTFATQMGGAVSSSQSVRVTSSSSTPIPFNVSITSTGWLSASPLSATTPSDINIAVNPVGLTVGAYTGYLILTSATASGIPQRVTVTMTVTAGLAVNPGSLSFIHQSGGSPPPPQTLLVSSSGGSGVNFAASPSASWLAISPASGATPASLSVSVQPPGIPVGVYSAAITIAVGGVSAQVVPITLTITASVALLASPSSLAFSQAQNGPPPDGKVVQITASPGAAGPLNYTATVMTNVGGNWLSVQPSAGTTPGTLTVSVNGSTLLQGYYTGQVTIQASGASNSPLPISVALTVGSPRSISVSPLSIVFYCQQGGTAPEPQSLVVSGIGGASDFTASASTASGTGWLRVSPTAGTTPANLSVSVNPGSLSSGEYTGTVTITSSVAGVSPQSAAVRLAVAASAVPAVTAVVNAASALPTPVAPGLLISIFGTNLGPTQGVAGRVIGGVLETMVAETRVLFDNTPAPLLYVRADQINAIAPYAVAGRATTQMYIEYRGTRHSPLMLQVVDAAPGIFAQNSQGTGQAAVRNQDYAPNGILNPAARDSVVMIFATGEGQTSPTGIDGRIAAAAPYPVPLLPVKLTIGGQDAEVLYAGAAPSFVAGAMQINARIPSEAPTGDQIPVHLTVGGRSGQIGVTLAVR